MKKEKDRFRGCLLGLPVGDALGATLEFKRPETFRLIKDVVGAAHLVSIPGNGPMPPPCPFVLLKA